MTVDPAFTAPERAELDACASSWRDYTAGRVNVSFDGGAGDFRMERRAPFPGGYETKNRVAWIDADGLAADGWDLRSGVRATCMNLLGRIMGMRQHTGRGVLSSDQVVDEFTDADHEACVAAGFC